MNIIKSYDEFVNEDIMSSTKDEHKPNRVVLGKESIGGAYCCTSIGVADMFLYIMPKLKECFDSKMLQLSNSPKYSNELSPAAVKFFGSDGKLIATYNREVMIKMPFRYGPFQDNINYIDTIMHNVITFGDSCDKDLFVDKCKDLSNGTVDFYKILDETLSELPLC